MHGYKGLKMCSLSTVFSGKALWWSLRVLRQWDWVIIKRIWIWSETAPKSLGQILWSLCLCVHACILSHLSSVQLCAALWTIACQAPLSMGFSRQEYWSGLLWDLLLQGIFLTQGLNPCLLHLLHWQASSLQPAPHGKTLYACSITQFTKWMHSPLLTSGDTSQDWMTETADST